MTVGWATLKDSDSLWLGVQAEAWPHLELFWKICLTIRFISQSCNSICNLWLSGSISTFHLDNLPKPLISSTFYECLPSLTWKWRQFNWRRRNKLQACLKFFPAIHITITFESIFLQYHLASFIIVYLSKMLLIFCIPISSTRINYVCYSGRSRYYI